MKKKHLTAIISVILVILMSLFGLGQNQDTPQTPPTTFATEAASAATAHTEASPLLPEDGFYNSKEEVALFIHLYGRLPDNYITKSQARELGWEGGSVEDYAPGKCIGGDRFGNYEELLPEAPGQVWYECDIDTWGRSGRGAKRIVFSSDGLIYYTDDHYESFTLLYGEADQ